MPEEKTHVLCSPVLGKITSVVRSGIKPNSLFQKNGEIVYVKCFESVAHQDQRYLRNH